MIESVDAITLNSTVIQNESWFDIALSGAYNANVLLTIISLNSVYIRKDSFNNITLNGVTVGIELIARNTFSGATKRSKSV